MNVSEAMISRKSVRAFLNKPIETSLLNTLIEKASRAPSGGNIQPWKIYGINGQAMVKFKKFSSEWSKEADAQYSIYQANLN